MGRIREGLFVSSRRASEAVVPHKTIEAADAWMIERLRAGLDARLATAEERVGIFEEARRRKPRRPARPGAVVYRGHVAARDSPISPS